MSELCTPCREKYWEEKTADEKLEKLASVIENQERRINELQAMSSIQSQVKVIEGQPYVPAHLALGNGPTLIGRREWLLNRTPRD